MQLVDAGFKILTPKNHIKGMLKRIEAAGRTCYKSEKKISAESAEDFCLNTIMKRGHLSVIEHESIQVRVVCDRGVTHEIVRHRLASYSQESTRYCNYGKDDHIKFIVPSDFELDHIDLQILMMLENHYNYCIRIGRKPQQARYFLPNGLKTEIVMTMNLREWRHFFNLRADEAAHPDMVALAKPMLTEFHELLPEIFGDLAIKHTAKLIIKG